MLFVQIITAVHNIVELRVDVGDEGGDEGKKGEGAHPGPHHYHICNREIDLCPSAT